MEVRATSISGVVTFKPRPHRDNRGVFTRTFDAAIGARHGVVFGEHAQDSQSRSAPGVLRGLHGRLGDGESKLMRFSAGAVFGVVGTVAMLWVGGHLVIESLAELGATGPHHVVAAAEHAVAGAGGLAQWCAESFLSGVFGLALGGFLALVWAVARRLVRRKR